MRVAVDASFLGARRGGDETFVTGLLEGLALRRGPADEFPVLVPHGARPSAVPDAPAFPAVPVRRAPGLWHFTATLPAVLRRLAPLDLAVTVTHAALVGAAPRALVLGDLSFVHRPQDYPAATGLRLRTLVPRHLASARGVLVPSEWTRRDVLETFDLDPGRVHVIPNTVRIPALLDSDNPALRTATAALAARGVRPPYLLYLGNLHPRKNVARLVTAFRRAMREDAELRGCRLVVAGGRWFRGSEEQRAAAGDPDVVFLGWVDDDERAALLAGADALAYVSLFEGFGLPPLEAMAHGCPVLASGVTSLPEVCGDAALLVDPLDEDSLTEGVRRILEEQALRTRLRLAGPRRAAEFDAGRVGDAALAALHAMTWTGSRPPARRGPSTGELGRRVG